ncbi:MAG: hypothetical protein ACYS5V_03940 [Planctomycetota bacterium]|jgi:hypothetical protein
MSNALVVLTCLALSAAPASGQRAVGTGPGAPRARGPKTIRLGAQPAAAPRPSLSWLLLPPVTEQTPGNAAQLYLLADAVAGRESKGEGSDKIDKWMQVPLSQIPVEAAQKVIARYASGLRQLELASRREFAHWDSPVRSEGFRAPMPNLSGQRHLARVLALRVRVHLVQGQHKQAVHDLQTGMAMAQHLGAGPTLIHSLVGTAIAAQMVPRVDELIDSPGSPNLYWALTALPRPMIGLTQPMAYERSMLLFAHPELRDLRTGKLSAQRWREIMSDLRALMSDAGDGGKSNWQEQLEHTLLTVRSYTRAKKALLAQGYPAKKVEAMPVHQVIGIHQFEVYERIRDEAFRWFYVPYWQAHDPLGRAAEELRRALAADPDSLFLKTMPTLARAYFLTTKVDRRIAALRCVEAIRMYAAAHDGRLPNKLADVTEAPLPLDPTTGKAFAYSVSGGTCVLSSPAPPGEEPKHALRYELTLKK